MKYSKKVYEEKGEPQLPIAANFSPPTAEEDKKLKDFKRMQLFHRPLISAGILHRAHKLNP